MSSNRLKVLLVSMLAVFAVSAVASGSASANEYQICEVGGTEKFETNQCASKVATGTFSWKSVVGKHNVESTGGAFTLTAGGKKVKCTAVTNTGEIGPGGESDETNITFTGCTANAGACWADSPGHDDGVGEKDGVIVVTDLDNQLVKRGTILADEFTENDATKEFVTLEFDTIAGDAEGCPGFPTTKVKGQVAGECTNITAGESAGEVELNFPEPELAGNTLEAFGVPASLVGNAEVFLTGVGAPALRCV
jgi:hypothetical protein